MTTVELEDYVGSVQLRTSGANIHHIANKLAGIRILVEEGLSEMPEMSKMIEKEKSNIESLLRGESMKHTSDKLREFSRYSTIGD